jgi:hypothetical protein
VARAGPVRNPGPPPNGTERSPKPPAHHDTGGIAFDTTVTSGVTPSCSPRTAAFTSVTAAALTAAMGAVNVSYATWLWSMDGIIAMDWRRLFGLPGRLMGHARPARIRPRRLAQRKLL